MIGQMADQFLADQLTLFQPKWADSAILYYLHTQSLSEILDVESYRRTE
jgi:hypothetical protein